MSRQPLRGEPHVESNPGYRLITLVAVVLAPAVFAEPTMAQPAGAGGARLLISKAVP